MTVRIGLLGILTIAFVTLKLVGAINWSWLWVLSPIWLPAAIFVAALLITLIGLAAYAIFAIWRES